MLALCYSRGVIAVVIHLTPDIETVLNQEAQRQGVSPEKLALDTLGKTYLEPQALAAATEGKNLYDFLAGYIGVIDGTSEALSEDCGRRYTDGLLERNAQGCP